MVLAAYLLEYGDARPWLANGSKRHSSWVIVDERSNPYVSWIRKYSRQMHRKVVEICLGALPVCSPMFPLNVDEITTTIEGIWSTTPITEAGFEEWAEIWGKCVVLEKCFGDMAISLS